MQARNNKKWKIGAEFCAYELYGEKIEGLKFVWIVDITETKIIGKIYEKYHYRTVEFSKKTGKQYRPTAYKWWWLTEREVKRINEKDINRNRKDRRLDSTNGGKAFRNPVKDTWFNDQNEIKPIKTKHLYADLSKAVGVTIDNINEAHNIENEFLTSLRNYDAKLIPTGGTIYVKRRKNI